MDQPEPTDVVVIGLGPGGEYAAGTLAKTGLHVTGVESRLVGGECPYYGCIPSKMMIRAADLIAETRRVPGLAGTSTVDPDWSPVALRIREEATDYWNDKKAADRFAGLGGHLIRRTRLADLGVGTIGLDENARAIPTDGCLRAADGVWALGDVTGKGAFTHMSTYQADIVVRDILGLGGEQADYRAVPRVTFTDPEIGSVGQTEEQARAAGLRVRTATSQIPASARGDVPVATLRNMPYAYPTFYRAISDALANLASS